MSVSEINTIHRSKRFPHAREELQSFILLAFPIFWWGVFFAFAFFRAIYFSFTDLTITTDSITVLNFDQYERLFSDDVFLLSLKNSVIWALVVTACSNFIGLVFAFFISKLRHGQKFLIGLLYAPSLVGAVVGSNITQMVFAADETGLLNKILLLFGVGPIAWYTDESLALMTLMIQPSLLGFAGIMLIYYVAIKNVSREQVEAAVVDGASSWKILWKIYVPSISNVVLYNVITSLIGGLQVIGPMQLVTNGGPNNSTMSLMLYLYQCMVSGENGYACAVGVVVLLIILTMSAFLLAFKKHSEKEGVRL